MSGRPALFLMETFVLGTLLCAQAWSAGPAQGTAPQPAAPKPGTSKQAPASPDPGAADQGEVDISDIQNQYWKAHDKQFEVIQNKQYTKAGRVEITPQFGLYQRVDFQDTQTLGGAVTYHFNEYLGLEAIGYKMYTQDSLVLTQLKQNLNATLDFNKEKYYVGLAPQITPIYAKFSFFGSKISHFDLYIAPNIGMTKTNAWRFTYGAGVGQKFWLSSHWNINLEYRWMQYQDRVYTSTGQNAGKNGGVGYYDDTVNDLNLIFGVSYLFN